MQQFEIELPFFCGFYESPLYNCDTLYWETYDEDSMEHYRNIFDDETLEADDLDIDWERFKNEVSEAFVDAFFQCDECPDFIEKMEFSEVVSPRYYNFETDKIYVTITIADDWKSQIKAFMDENKDWLTKRIREDWSDRDGFWSYMDNTFDYWYEELQKDEPDTRYIGIIIKYMMYLTNKNVRDDLICDVLDDLYIGEYIINTKEKKN